jgi:hypothetical protein
MKILLAPLQVLSNLMNHQNKVVDEIHNVLTVDLKRAATENSKDLKESSSILSSIDISLKKASEKATERSASNSAILGDIRDLLKEQNKPNEAQDAKAPKVKFPGFMKAVGVGLALVTMAGALLAAAGIFSIMPTVSPSQLLTALAVGGILLMITPIYLEISESFARSGSRVILDKVTGNDDANSSMKGRLKNMGVVGLAVIGMALVTVVAASLFTMIPTISGSAFLTALAVALVLIPLSIATSLIIKGLSRSNLKLDSGSLQKIAILPLIISAMALGVVGAAYAFKLLPSEFPKLPPIGWVIKASIMILAFSFTFNRIATAIKGMKIKTMLMIALALPAIALGIVLTAEVFTMMPDEADIKAPPLKWAAKTALALMVFSIPFILLATFSKISLRSTKSLLLTTLAMSAIAGSILSTAWIFSYLPDEFKTVPHDWAIGAAIAITVFAIPMAIIGALSMALTPAALLLGAGGIILLAGTMWVVAWIFSTLPDLSAISKNFTDAIMYPVNAMMNTLKRFKDEIGIENMLPLAGGILAIAGSWLVLTAAMAGQGIGGAIGAYGNLISTGINKISEWLGGEKAMGPKDLLELLIDKAEGLKKVSLPLKNIGTGFKGISLHASSVQLALGALIPFTQEDEVDELKDSANAITKIAKGYSSIAKSTKVMNVDALNASASMFNAIARVAESKGDDILTKISEELMEAVKQLSDTVKNLEEANGKNSTSITDSISGTLSGFIDKIKGTSGGSGKEAGLIDIQPIVEAIQELEERFSRPIRVQEI